MSILEIRQKVAKQIKKLRIKAGLTQEAMAERLDMSVRYYQHLESSKPGAIKIDTLYKIAQSLGIPLWKLLKF